MAESDGAADSTTNEQRLARLEAARKELEGSFIVMTHLETKAAARVREHAEFIAAHEAAIAKQVQRTSVLDERVDKLAVAIGELISEAPPGKAASGQECPPHVLRSQAAGLASEA